MIRHALQDDRTDIIDTWLQRGGNIDVVSKSSGSLLHSVYLGSAEYCENIEFLLQRGKIYCLLKSIQFSGGCRIFQRERDSQVGLRQPIIWQLFVKNYMKINDMEGRYLNQ